MLQHVHQQLSIALVVTIVIVNVLASTSGSMTRDRFTRKSDNRHKFISFDTDEETIEMAAEFSVPFLQIPKSLGKFSSSLARGENPAIINFSALLLLAVIALIGSAIGSLRAPGMSLDSSGLTSLFKTDADNEMESSNWVWTSLKDSVMHEDGLLNDCAQKFICLTASEAIERRRKGGNTQLDNLIEEVGRRVHVGDVKFGGSVAKAINRAFSGSGCGGFFRTCSMKINPLQHYLI